MSTPAEKIAAQKAAFEHQPSEHWHRHLVGPDELEYLMRCAGMIPIWRKKDEAREILAADIVK